MLLSERQDIRHRIQTCYIERLIYDEIYKNLTLQDENQQDEGHIHRLNIVKEDFKTCFPNLDISVSIEFDMHLPIALNIKRSIRGILTSQETYTRTIVFDNIFGGKKYSDEIQATRMTNTYLYRRIQTFTHDRSHWTKTRK